jgi:Tol biopolymer transport system component
MRRENAMRLLVRASAAALLAGCSGAPAVSSPPVATDVPSVAALTAAPTIVPSPRPIPILDGEPWIAYEWWLPDHEDADLFLVRPDGRDSHAIAEDLPGEHRGPVWSPDGAQLAFVIRGDATPAPNGGIWISDADGSDAKPLFDAPKLCPDGAFWPVWSPDGKRMSVTCYVGGASTLQVVDLTTLKMTEIASVRGPEGLDNPASWSPDGKWLAFDIQHWDPTNAFTDGSLLAVAPSAGGEVRRITDFDSFAAYPAWHPTEDRIAFNTYDLGAIKLVPGAAGVFTIAPDGSNLRPVATMPDTSVRLARVRWTAGGASLIANVVHGNPSGPVEIVLVDGTTWAWAGLSTPTQGGRPELRPTP